MTQDPARRLGLGSPALVRLLAGLADAGVSAPGQPLAERLGQWLGWADAIALSAALNGAPPAVPAGAAAEEGAGQGEYALLRASLRDAIAAVNAPPATRRRGPWGGSNAGKAKAAPVDYPTYRQRYVSLQQKMETRIAELRARLRGMLASRTPEMARLALVDAAMEQALAQREQTLLLKVPALLEDYFNRLRQTQEESGEYAQAASDAALLQARRDAAPRLSQHPSGEGAGGSSVLDGHGAMVGQADGSSSPPRHMPAPSASAPPAQPAWLDVFRKDMQSVLLAELDLRLQPIEGLLAALRASEPSTL